MADTKLSALTEMTDNLVDTDEFYVNDGGTSKRVTRDTIMYKAGGWWTPSDGAIGDSHASYSSSSNTGGRPWNLYVGVSRSVSNIAAGSLCGGYGYLRQVTDADTLMYRMATAKTSGNFYFGIYDMDDAGLPTGAPLWTHQVANPTSNSSKVETGLTPWSLDRGWYFIAGWNPDDGGGACAYRSFGGPPCPLVDPTIQEYVGIEYIDGGTSGGPPTLAGTETWAIDNCYTPNLGIVDSTS